ncbi:MAG TPA: DUF4259 domain-containing protein [Phycisphaerales bacterium]|nr:DUF4259 domain-containing protein [Phycisphaerales bacterium]
MAAWGTGPFDNDDALDYVMDVADAPDGEGDGCKLPMVMQCITRAASARAGSCDAIIAANALVAAEIIAALRGKGHPELVTAEVEDDDGPMAALVAWIRDPARKDGVVHRADVMELARRAVERVRNESELAELWSEAEPKNAAEWRAAADDLLHRLRG